jgi:hypothetical protein
LSLGDAPKPAASRNCRLSPACAGAVVNVPIVPIACWAPGTSVIDPVGFDSVKAAVVGGFDFCQAPPMPVQPPPFRLLVDDRIEYASSVSDTSESFLRNACPVLGLTLSTRSFSNFVPMYSTCPRMVS